MPGAPGRRWLHGFGQRRVPAVWAAATPRVLASTSPDGLRTWPRPRHAEEGVDSTEAPHFKNRPDSALPMRFFALALAGFLALTAALLADPRALRWPLGPGGILVLHLTVLAWITPAMMGADYQLIPVLLSAPRPGRRLADAVLWPYAAGVAGFLAGWALGSPPLIAAGGAVAGAALLLFCGHVGGRLLRGRMGGPTALGLAGGLAFLALAAVLGPWMALSGAGAVPAAAHMRALHAAAGLGGWLVLTIEGATYRLVPFFAATPAAPPRFGPTAVACSGLGVLLLLVAAVLPPVPAAAGAAALWLGMALWASDLVDMARRGRQARREPVTAYSLAAAAALVLGSAGGATALGAGWVQGALAALVLAVLAGPSLLILGQMQKIVPFVAALEAALAAKGRGRAPKTEALFPRGDALRLLWLLGPGMAAEVAGVAAGMPPLTRAGAALVLAAAGLYAARQARAFAAWHSARRAPEAPGGRP